MRGLKTTVIRILWFNSSDMKLSDYILTSFISEKGFPLNTAGSLLVFKLSSSMAVTDVNQGQSYIV